MEGKAKSKKRGLSRQEAYNIYSDLQQSVINLLKRDVPDSQGEQVVTQRSSEDHWLRGMLVLIGILALTRGCLAIFGLTGVLEVLPAEAKTNHISAAVALKARDRAEAELFEDLDQARAELDKRRVLLEDRQAVLADQEEKLAVRLAELRQLTSELRVARQANAVERDTQLEQLANVYVSMQPSEAARLLQELDTMIALDLIKKMPEKRIGQLLSMMEPKKALIMTRMLTGS
jgi:flagellar motility protein MotE (MotC chaperone)